MGAVMLTFFDSLASAYIQGLRELGVGDRVPSVLDPLSKASNFGLGDRPSVELLAHGFGVLNPHSCVVSSRAVPIHLPYGLALLAYTLDGRNDVDSLAYYRPGASDYSDDGYTLSGAFGRRLFGSEESQDQLTAILHRIAMDPASRRTFAAI